MLYQLKEIQTLFDNRALKSVTIGDQTKQEWEGFTMGFETKNDTIFLRSQRDNTHKLFKNLESAYKTATKIGFREIKVIIAN